MSGDGEPPPGATPGRGPGPSPDPHRRGDAADVGFTLPPVAATLLLTAIAGYVDAFGYVYLFGGTFAANQSGNVALLGIAIGDDRLGDAATSLIALLGFGLGAALGIYIDSHDPTQTAKRPQALLAIEVALLVGITVAVAVIGGDHPLEGVARFALLGATSLAMGVQTPVVTRTHGVPTPTTFMSGSVARLSNSLTEALRQRGTRSGRSYELQAVLLAIVLVGYVAGAAVGTAIGGVWREALVLPTLALAALVASRAVRDRRARGSGPGR